jgi:hypothetical protein
VQVATPCPILVPHLMWQGILVVLGCCSCCSTGSQALPGSFCLVWEVELSVDGGRAGQDGPVIGTSCFLLRHEVTQVVLLPSRAQPGLPPLGSLVPVAARA